MRRTEADLDARERAAVRLMAGWMPGVCHFCMVRDDAVDGDRLRWLTTSRSVCSNPACVRQLSAVLERSLTRPRQTRRSPGDIHAQIVEEARAKRKRYREAAKARKKGRAA